MTIYELKRLHLTANPVSYFFDSDTLKFFGEALSRMRVLKNTTIVTDVCENKHTCFVVSATRTKNWSGSCKPYPQYHYFDIETLQNVIL